MDAEATRGIGDIAARLLEGALDEEVFSFCEVERERLNPTEF